MLVKTPDTQFILATQNDCCDSKLNRQNCCPKPDAATYRARPLCRCISLNTPLSPTRGNCKPNRLSRISSYISKGSGCCTSFCHSEKLKDWSWFRSPSSKRWQSFACLHGAAQQPNCLSCPLRKPTSESTSQTGSDQRGCVPK